MSQWKQVSGDMSFDSHGLVLAKDEGSYVDLVKIDPWLELDSSSLSEGYGFWCVDSTTIDKDDMGLNGRDVKEAIRSVGMDPEEYEKLEPIYKAEIIASYSGYDDSRSTSDYADALPAPIEEIEFWSGPGSKFDVASINDEMRMAVVYKLYGGDFDEDDLPDDEALELAWGDGPRTFDLDDDQAQALRYAYAVTSGSYDWQPPRDDDRKLVIADAMAFKRLLETLQAAPDSADQPATAITKLQAAYQGSFDLDWEDKREQTAYLIDEDAKEAKNLIKELLSRLGF
jgi:hypothetical protein